MMWFDEVEADASVSLRKGEIWSYFSTLEKDPSCVVQDLLQARYGY